MGHGYGKVVRVLYALTHPKEPVPQVGLLNFLYP